MDSAFPAQELTTQPCSALGDHGHVKGSCRNKATSYAMTEPKIPFSDNRESTEITQLVRREGEQSDSPILRSASRPQKDGFKFE